MAAETPNTETEQEHGYTIDGELYLEPESLTVADHRVFKRYTGWNYRELVKQGVMAVYLDQDAIAAWAHIAYRHRHEELTFEEIEEIIGRQDMKVMQSTLEIYEGGVPLALMSESDAPENDSTPNEKNKDSGDDSKTNSDPSAENPATTGTSESDTPSPASALATTAASAN